MIPQDSHYCLRKTTCKTDQSLISLCLVSPGSNANKVFKLSSVCLDPKMQLTFFSASRAIHTSRDGPINSFFFGLGHSHHSSFSGCTKRVTHQKIAKIIFFEHQKRNMNLIITHKKGSKFENFGDPKVFALFKIESFFIYYILYISGMCMK